MSHPVWYTRRMKNMKNKIEITEAQLLLNQEVKVTSPRSQFFGEIGHVRSVMADGRTLEIEIKRLRILAFVDVTLVSEVRDTPTLPIGVGAEQSLGPIANSVVQAGR